MLQTLKLTSKKRKNFAFPKKKSLVGSTPGQSFLDKILNVVNAVAAVIAIVALMLSILLSSL